ncbi:MAG: thioredoxin family protein [bacterium]|nr:thioredoxin family protein [bacterium]
MNKKEKEQLKTGIIIVLILVIIFGGSYFASELKSDKYKNSSTTPTSNNTNTSSDDTSSSDISEDEQAELNSIDIDKYLSLKKGSDKSIIYISRPTCHYCQQEDPIIKNIVYETKITVNYLNTDELDDDGNSKLIKSDDYFSEGYGTPLLLVVQKDKIVDKLEGLTSKENIVSFFKKYGFIND